MEYCERLYQGLLRQDAVSGHENKDTCNRGGCGSLQEAGTAGQGKGKSRCIDLGVEERARKKQRKRSDWFRG